MEDTELGDSKPIAGVSLVYTYYENPKMLARLINHLNSFSADVLSKIELIVVDDGSPSSPASFAGVEVNFPYRLFRVEYDLPWSQSGARNIGAFECAQEWMFLLDMDKEVPESTLRTLLDMSSSPSDWYLFSRRKVGPPIAQLGRHHNTIFMSRSFYWKVGGFDENFDGYYGTAQFFGLAAEKIRPYTFLKDLFVHSVTMDVVEDAGTRSLNRSASFFQRLSIWAKRIGRSFNLIPRKTLSHPYHEVF